MAHLLRQFQRIGYQGKLIQTSAALCQFSRNFERNFEKNPLQSPIGAKYINRRDSSQHQWLEGFKTAILTDEQRFEPSEKWIQELEEKFIAESNGNLVNFDLVLMTTLKKLKQAKMGMLLMQYIRRNRKPSMLVVIEYMLCCHVVYPKQILEEYKSLKESVDLATVNINTLCSLAKVAARTCLWRDSYEMLDLLQKEVDLGEHRHVLEYAVATVLCSGIVTCNFELILEMAYKHQRLYNRSLRRGLITPALVETWKRGDIHLDLMLELLCDMGKFLNLRDGQALEIKEFCNTELADKVKCELTEVHAVSGECIQCSEKLPKSSLTDAEFELLQAAMIEKLVYGENIYQSTTPEAISNFLKFLHNANYDVIIDGPNVYHSRDVEFWSLVPKLLNEMKRFLQKKHLKVLVIADTSRFKAFYKIPRQLQKSVDLYQVDFRLSNDDIFMLVAAFKSGRDTYILTNDNLRNHIARLGDPCDKLFNMWQKGFQIMHDKEILEFPAGYDCRTHVTDHGWHVPYELDQKSDLKLNAYFKDTKRFLCIQKLKPFQSAKLCAYKDMKSKFERMYDTRIDESLA